MKLHLRDRCLEKPAPLIMGILNVTPDSFSDGGRFLSFDDALRQARAMAEAGADILDIGGESTRPGALEVSLQEQVDRILPVIQAIKREMDILISVDTYQCSVAETAVREGGADLINDISALRFSAGMAELAASLGVPVVLMHIQGTPRTMQDNPVYTDVVAEVSAYFQERIDFAVAGGIARERLWLDPGIGFGKNLEDNITLIRHLNEFQTFHLPIVLGVSRKSFLGKIAGETRADRRDAETISANLVGLLRGAAVLRVHDVKATVAAIRVFSRLWPWETERPG